jgi:thimet oligopeptidase
VETFFHEFGHIMHFTLTNAKYASQSGFSVAWDFVEAPSQMLENWVWDRTVLRKISSHHKTGKPLPEKLITSMVRAKNFAVAYTTARQITLSLFDYILHTTRVSNPNQLYSDLTRKYTGIQMPKSHLYAAGFGHLAHGYDGGYYGYLWSEVFAQDLFTRFQKAGVLSSRVGKDYRKWILEKGSSIDELQLVKNFLGRKPNNKAFLKSIGVKS